MARKKKDVIDVEAVSTAIKKEIDVPTTLGKPTTGKEIKRPKFLQFRAVLTDRTDANGNYVIDYFYDKQEFPAEDVLPSVEAFERLAVDDLKKKK